MKICGIIAEYNPLHTGHAAHLQQVRRFADAVVVVMSGHLMQRGELARYDKWSRAKAALLCGADLVIELPTSFCCASAERFASGGISILRRLGCVSSISFGSECGDIGALSAAAQACASIDGSLPLQAFLSQGLSYPKARRLALGAVGEVLELPNNTLGVEYIKAALRQNASFSFHTLKREGAAHDSCTPSKTASASFLRAHPERMPNYLPAAVLPLFRSPARLPDILLLHRLRSMQEQDFAQLPDVTEGLENRLARAARQAVSAEEFYALVKTKRYTHSRLRRIGCYALLDMRAAVLPQQPSYARVLGFSETGRQLLGSIRKTAEIAVSPDFPALARRFPDEATLDARATDLFTLCLSSPRPCGEDWRAGVVQI